MDIADWLQSLGLDHFAQAFEEAEVDAEVLPELTDADLREIGIPLGPRKKLLKAIAALAGAGPSAPAAPPAVEATVPRPEAQRRQLTVVFCDLVGSTALSAGLDPEDMREVITGYQSACAEVVRRFEGHIAKFMGDGVLAYFGYPQAHEDDAERAVRASLELIEAVGRLAAPGGGPLQTRVGIDTGLVVVGDLVGEDAAQEEAVVGDTPNLAARLQALAEPDGLLISAATKRLLGAAFTFTDRGPRPLKGFAEPLRVWQVTGLSAAESRFDARAAAGLTPFVGREEEIALMLGRWHQAKDGEGQVALLCGEPGIGKSRIMRELRETSGATTVLRYQCSPHHTNSALHPFIDQIERAAGYDRADRAPAKLDALEAALAPAFGDVGAVAPLFASLLSLDVGDRHAPLALSPQRQKQDTIAALALGIVGLASGGPLLVLFEDAHWADPTTLEALDALVDAIEDAPILVVITFRPEFQPPWMGRGYVTLHTLARLGRRLAASMVDGVTGGHDLPAEVIEEIVAKTDGVPLFVEELTKMIIESGMVVERGGAYTLRRSFSGLSIPSTLHDSLMARLDRLSPVKEIAQIGACIGRRFPHELLAAVSPLSANELGDALGQLTDAEIVFQRGTPPDASYTFKHALVQDAAYESLLKSRRRQLHQQIARTLESSDRYSAEDEPEIVAHHYTEAAMPEPAIVHWIRAGEHAAARSSNAEAIAHVKRGLDLVKDLRNTTERAQAELKLLNTMAAPLMNTKGYAAPETGQVYNRVRELCQEAGVSNEVFPALAGVATYDMCIGELDQAYALAEELLRLAGQQDESGPLIEGLRMVGLTAVFLGQFNKAKTHLDRVRELYDPDEHVGLAWRYGQNHLMSSYALGSWCPLYLGYPDKAEELRMAALCAAKESNHYFTQAYAYALTLFVPHLRRDVETVRISAEEAVTFSDEQGFLVWSAAARVFKGWTLAESGQFDESIATIEEGISIWKACGLAVWLPYWQLILADSLMKSGKLSRGLEIVEGAIELVEKTNERFYLPEPYRLKGHLLRQIAPENADEVESLFEKARGIARSQGAKSWEIRAATCLAHLWRDQGRHAEARDLLAPVYDWFTEGFDTADLREAKALLDQLR